MFGGKEYWKIDTA